MKGQIGGSYIWLIRIGIAVLMIILVPSWLADSPPDQYLYRIFGILLLIAVTFGDWAKSLVKWIVKNLFRRYR